MDPKLFLILLSLSLIILFLLMQMEPYHFQPKFIYERF